VFSPDAGRAGRRSVDLRHLRDEEGDRIRLDHKAISLEGGGYSCACIPLASQNIEGQAAFNLLTTAVGGGVGLGRKAATSAGGRLFANADNLAPNAAGARGAERGGLNLFKWNHPTSTTASGWREGDRMLTVPLKGTPKAQWKENASRLRREMRSSDPIYETYVDEAGNLIPTTGFLNAERNLLLNRGWQYNPRTRAWTPGQ
jgi:hypothetical protein